MADQILIKGEKPLSISPVEPSPCSMACPLETNAKAYVSLIAAGRFAEALEVVRQTNPFPGICGRVCPHPCEDQCHRGEIDEPVSIATLKRFIADYELRRGAIPRYGRKGKKRGKVAVIGAGPTGLTCAADLAREGYKVRVFEALPVPGGMMATGIPPYRLPRDILRTEIAAIEALGVEIKPNTRIGDRVKFEDLVRKFDAVFIATGAQEPSGLGIPGEREVQHGLINWIPLLRECALDGGKKPGDNVVIVGGGNTAVDCARVVLRLGTKHAQILYRRSREEMPAFREEVADAEEEGVKIHFLSAPVRLLVEEGKLNGVKCVRMRLGKKDRSGRPRPIPIENSEYVIPCDAIIPAIGQQLDPSFLGEKHALSISKEQLLKVDPVTMATNQEGVFAGGDAVNGPASVVEAIAAGHRAARSMGRYLDGVPLRSHSAEVHPDLKEAKLDLPSPSKMPRIRSSRIGASERRYSFDEVELGLSEAQAVAEAERCMRCGMCLECTECVGVCDGKQVILEPAHPSKEPPSHKHEMLVRVPPEIHRRIAAQGTVSAEYQRKPYEVSAFTARVNEHLCTGCGLCEEICTYRAPRVLYQGDGVFTAQIDEDMCRGCGACVAVCPTDAIDQNHFTTERLERLITTGLRRRGRLPIVTFTCRWSRTMRSASSRLPTGIVPVMCTGRVGGGDVLRAFERGAAGVLVVGCANEDCHYGFGSQAANENLRRVSEILSLLGIDPRRVQSIRIPAEDRPDLVDVIRNFSAEIKKVGTDTIGKATWQR